MAEEGAAPGGWTSGLEQLAGIGAWAVRFDALVPEWSDGQRLLYGVAAGDVRDLDDWAALVHPDDRTLWRRSLDATIDRGAGYAIDHRLVRADDGVVRWLRCRGRVDPGAAVVGVSVDTTDHHLASAGFRTFIADAAHELRTPAAAIGQAVAALQVVEGDQREEVVAVLNRQATRLRTLTTDLVDLAQLDAGPIAIVLEPVPLASAIAVAVEHAPPPSARTVELDVAPDLAVLATPLHLDRVLVNLLTNAYRYGGPSVSVAGHRRGDRVVVEVADDGEGIPADAVEELFHAFRRGPQRHPEASGLGLAIVARLVDRFGGEVSYRPGAPGAVFVVDLASG